MENSLATKNVGRKPLSVLYSANRGPPPVAAGKAGLQAVRDAPPVKPSFIYCDSQDENADANLHKSAVERKPLFTLYTEDNDSPPADQDQVETKPFAPCNEEDENARGDFGSGKSDVSIMQSDEKDENTSNTVDLESVAGSTKSTFVMYEDRNGSATAEAIDYEMAEKSRSSILSVSMHSAMASSDFMSSQSERAVRKDIVESCRDYAQDIHTYLREMEKKCRPKSHYIRKQPEITQDMRTVLVDWLVDVCSEYDLNQETLHLAVGYTDRFLSIMAVRKEHLQLLGVTSMMIAAKYEEIYPPDLQEFVYITDDTYSKREVLQMEQILLKALDFNLSAPTSNLFLISYLNSSRAGQRCQHMAKYLCDLALMEYSFLAYVPSLVAASCTFLAHYITDGIPGALTIPVISGYDINEIYPCAQALLAVFKCASDSTQQAIRDKYKDDKFCRVALLEPPAVLPSPDSL